MKIKLRVQNPNLQDDYSFISGGEINWYFQEIDELLQVSFLKINEELTLPDGTQITRIN